MTTNSNKKRLRAIKKKIKRSGNKKVRADLKRDLATNPEEAHNELERGQRRSENLNGMDYDAKRKKKKRSLYDQANGGIIPPDCVHLEENNDAEGRSEEENLPPLRAGEQGECPGV